MPRAALVLSRFAQRLVAARPALNEEIEKAEEAGWNAESMGAFLTAGGDSADPTQLASRLRELRARVLLRVALRDLAGLASLSEVVATMSDLAELALGCCIALPPALLEAEHGTPANGGDLLLVGMGKLGGRELNVSSDIDLVFVYPEEGDTAGAASALQPRVLHPSRPR